MAQVNFTITQAQTKAITDYLGYKTEIDEKPNPETRKVFLYGKVKDYLKSCYRSEMAKDGEVARVAALEQAETDLENLDVSE